MITPHLSGHVVYTNFLHATVHSLQLDQAYTAAGFPGLISLLCNSQLCRTPSLHRGQDSVLQKHHKFHERSRRGLSDSQFDSYRC